MAIKSLHELRNDAAFELTDNVPYLKPAATKRGVLSDLMELFQVNFSQIGSASNYVASTFTNSLRVDTLTAKSSTINLTSRILKDSGELDVGSASGSIVRLRNGNDTGLQISQNGAQFGASGPKDFYGLGDPEGVVSAVVGSTFRRTDGSLGNSFYLKSEGTGNLGWERLRSSQIVNVKDFGAKGDGESDDTVAFKAAIATGKNVYIPTSTSFYKLTEPLVITTPNQKIIGSGNGSGLTGSSENHLSAYTSTCWLKWFGDGTPHKKVVTRRNWRGSALDPTDDPYSVCVNVQAEGVTLSHFTIGMDIDFNDPDDYGANWDIGLLNGCRLQFKTYGLHIVGYHRIANYYNDVSRASNLPELDESYPRGTIRSGSDGTRHYNPIWMGGRWAEVVLGGIRDISGQYFNEESETLVTDGRGNSGVSDYTVVDGHIVGGLHHSNKRWVDNLTPLDNEAEGYSSGASYIDSPAGNSTGRAGKLIWDNCRFESKEAYLCRLDRIADIRYITAQYEWRNREALKTDGVTVVDPSDTENHGYGAVSATTNTGSVLLIDPSTNVPSEKWFWSVEDSLSDFTSKQGIGIQGVNRLTRSISPYDTDKQSFIIDVNKDKYFADVDTVDNLHTLSTISTFTRASAAFSNLTSGSLKSYATNTLRFGSPSKNSPKGILIETTATALNLKSEDFSNVAWTKSGVESIDIDHSDSPAGTLTANLIVPNAADVPCYFEQAITVNNATPYSSTIYVSNQGDYKKIRIYHAADKYVDFDAETGLFIAGDTDNAYLLTENINGFYRIGYNSTTTSTTLTPRIYVLDTDGSENVQGDLTDGLLAWGYNLTKGFPSSYIQTDGTAVTRSGDNLKLDPTDHWLQMCETATFLVDVTLHAPSLNLSGADYRRYLFHTANASSGLTDSIECYIFNQTLTLFSRNNSVSETESYTIPFTLTPNYRLRLLFQLGKEGVKFWVNGNSGTLSSTPINLQEMTVFKVGNGQTDSVRGLEGFLHELKVFPYALSDTKCRLLSRISF